MEYIALAGGLSGGGMALWVLKKIPNDKICSVVEGFFEKIGIVMTAGLTKFWATKKIWNKTVEPYFIDLLSNTVEAGVEGFIEGLRSDK